jgi:hypothetical protein
MIRPARHLSILAALALTPFAGILTLAPTGAHAVECVKGAVRAGCAGPHGAAVVGPRGAAVAGHETIGTAAVRAPVAACHYVVVNGVRVRRCD